MDSGRRIAFRLSDRAVKRRDEKTLRKRSRTILKRGKRDWGATDQSNVPRGTCKLYVHSPRSTNTSGSPDYVPRPSLSHLVLNADGFVQRVFKKQKKAKKA